MHHHFSLVPSGRMMVLRQFSKNGYLSSIFSKKSYTVSANKKPPHLEGCGGFYLFSRTAVYPARFPRSAFLGASEILAYTSILKVSNNPDACFLKSKIMQASKKSIVPFDFDGVSVRAILRDGQPWFVAADVCVALGYVNPRDAITKHLDDDDRSTIANNDSQLIIINESGLYSLVLSSRKPEAKRFKKWVTSEVLPQIHRTGQYQTDRLEKRHAIASTSKVLSSILQHIRNAAGKVTKDHHYQNEHKLVNSLLSGQFKGMDREQMSIYDMDFLAHFEIRNAVLIGSGVQYQQRKADLIAEAKAWKKTRTPVLEAQLTTASLAL